MHIDNVADIWPDMVSDNKSNIYGLEHGENAVCPQPFYDICIHSDGTVTPCDAIFEYDKYNLGNIREKSIKEIWRGDGLRELQLQLLKGETTTFEICNKCNFANCGASVNITPYREGLLLKYEEGRLYV